jgi:hypothetical protein
VPFLAGWLRYAGEQLAGLICSNNAALHFWFKKNAAQSPRALVSWWE